MTCRPSLNYALHTNRLMLFVFLSSGFCLGLPSDSDSRRTPLLLANGW